MPTTHPHFAQKLILEALGFDVEKKPYIRSATLDLSPQDFPCLTVRFVLTEEEQIGLIAEALATFELRRKDA